MYRQNVNNWYYLTILQHLGAGRNPLMISEIVSSWIQNMFVYRLGIMVMPSWYLLLVDVKLNLSNNINTNYKSKPGEHAHMPAVFFLQLIPVNHPDSHFYNTYIISMEWEISCDPKLYSFVNTYCVPNSLQLNFWFSYPLSCLYLSSFCCVWLNRKSLPHIHAFYIWIM